MATTMLAGTPYRFCMAASCSDHLAKLAAPGGGERRSAYSCRSSSPGCRTRADGWAWAARASGSGGPPGTAGSGSTRCGSVQLSFSPLRLASKVLRETTRRFGVRPQRLRAKRRSPCLPRAYRRQPRRQPLAPRPAPVPRARTREPDRSAKVSLPTSCPPWPSASQFEASRPDLAVALRRRQRQNSVALGGGAVFDQPLFPAKRMADDGVEVVEPRLPAEHLADPVGLGDDGGGIAVTSRGPASRQNRCCDTRFTEPITSSTEKPLP